MKDDVGSLDRNLGANAEKVQLQDGSVAWSMTCVDYLKDAIENVVKTLQDSGTSLKNFGDGEQPYVSAYRTKLDVTLNLDDEMTNRYQKLIGILRWPIELGRIDINTKVSCMSKYLCNPRENHLHTVYKIFRYP